MCRLCRLELVAGPCVLAPPEAAPFAPLHAVCSFIVHDWSPYFLGWLQPLGRVGGGWRRCMFLQVVHGYPGTGTAISACDGSGVLEYQGSLVVCRRRVDGVPNPVPSITT